MNVAWIAESPEEYARHGALRSDDMIASNRIEFAEVSREYTNSVGWKVVNVRMVFQKDLS